jgi:hypothetical protein
MHFYFIWSTLTLFFVPDIYIFFIALFKIIYKGPYIYTFNIAEYKIYMVLKVITLIFHRFLNSLNIKFLPIYKTKQKLLT